MKNNFQSLTEKGRWLLATLTLIFTLGIGQMWGTSYIPGTKKTVTANETIDYATIAGANATTSGKWIVNPRGGTTSSKKYTNVNGDSKGNPDGITDNIPSISSNVNMPTIQVPSTAKYNQNGKYVIHMRITGITGIIVHGVTGSSGRGAAIYGQEYTTSLTENTEYGTALASMTRSGNSGSFILQYTSFTASKEYLITIAATGGDDQLYAIELIAPATSHTVTYKSGWNEDLWIADPEATTVADCPSQFSYTGHDFAGWKDGDNNDVEVGANVTKDMTLTAQWVEHVDKYTVKYMDGTTVLGTEQVNVNSTPVGLAEDPKKDCYTFAAWDPALNTISGEKDQVIEVSATWTAVYSSSATLISDDVKTNKPNVNTVFAASKIVSSITFTSGNYEFSSNETKPGYYGYKDKASGDYMKILVQQGKRVQVLFGNLGADPTITANGVAQSLDAARTTGDMAENTFTYDASSADALISITMGSGTNTLKTVTIEDIPALSDDATLSDLTLKYGTEDPATISGFASSKQIYNVEVPYGTAKADLPIVGATATDATNALVTINQAKDREDWKTVIRVQAEDRIDAHDKYYEVRFEVQPKLGVEVFAYTPVGSNGEKDATGYKGGKADIKLQTSKTGDGYKLGSVGHYIGIAVDGGLKANDLICIDIADLQGASKLTFFDGKTDGKAQVITPAPTPKVGKNYVTVPSNMDSIYLYRADGTCNPSVKSVAVYREMESFFESFTVAGVAATIDETVSPKTITVEVPNVTDITALTPTYKAWANGGATVSPTTAQNFSVGAVDYTVTSAYEETTTYKVTVTKAAAIKEVVISGTLSVKEDETTALSAVVYDTNDQEAAIQDVTWSVKAGDENLASVDANGVVTGKAIGTAHIIATSVADNTISAQVEVEVSENPCRVWNAPTSSWSDALVTVGKLQIARGDCPASSEMTPYSGASKCYGIKIDGSAKFIELTMSDGAQFESLTLGVSSGSNGSSPKYVVVASSAKTFATSAVLSAVEYVANAKDAEQSLNVIDLPTGTRNVRLYRSYDSKGGSSSVYLYYINACKKEFVPVTAVAVADANLAIDKSMTLSATTTPANADIASFVWSIESMTATNVTILGNVLTAANNATEGEVIVKVVATDVLNNVVEATATIHIVNKFEVVKPVTGTTTWDWEPVSVLENGPTISAPDTVLANYISGEIWEMLAGGNGDRPYRGTSYKAFQGKTLYFETTVPGKLKMYAGRISNNQKVYVNGIEVGEVTSTKGYLNEIVVPAGPVYITAGTNGMRIYNMIFNAEPDHERDVVIGNMGTVCLPNPSRAFGVKVYELAGKGEGCKVQFDELGENEVLAAGKSYVLVMTDTKAKFFYTNTESPVTEADWTTAMKGNLSETPIEFAPLAEDAKNVVFFKDNAMWNAYETGLRIKQYRAYLQYDEVTAPTSGPANGRRRVTLNLQQTEVATGFENLNASEKPMKLMIDGQIYILRGEKLYDATGRLVK